MNYLEMESEIYHSIVNMKLRYFYNDIEDLCLSENIDFKKFNKKLESFGFIYDPQNNRLYSK